MSTKEPEMTLSNVSQHCWTLAAGRLVHVNGMPYQLGTSTVLIGANDPSINILGGQATPSAVYPPCPPAPKTVGRGEIPEHIQAQIVADAMRTFTQACGTGAEAIADALAGRAARAGVAAWQIANGIRVAEKAEV